MRTLRLLGFLSLLSCESRNEGSAEAVSELSKLPEHKKLFRKELVKVTGSYVSFRISTFVGITCEGYDKHFSSTNPIIIIDKVKLAAIESRLKLLSPDINKYGIDTRAKVIFFYNDRSTDTLCISQFNGHYRGELVSNDIKLNQLLGVKTE